MADSLESGVTVTQLAFLFRSSVPVVRRKIASVRQIGERSGSPLYDLYDVSPYLVKPQFDVEEYIRNLKPTELPASLQKDFWNAQRARQQYEEEAKQLWRTEKVVQVLTRVFKLLRHQIVLFSDTVGRETGLTTKQRAVLDGLVDQLLSSMREALVEELRGYVVDGDRDEILEKGVPTPIINHTDDDEDEPIDIFG